MALRGGMDGCKKWVEDTVEQLKAHPAAHHVFDHPETILFQVLSIAGAIWLFVRAIRMFSRKETAEPSTPDIERPKSLSRNTSFKAPACCKWQSLSQLDALVWLSYWNT